jgi:hypothetical protein
MPGGTLAPASGRKTRGRAGLYVSSEASAAGRYRNGATALLEKPPEPRAYTTTA